MNSHSVESNYPNSEVDQDNYDLDYGSMTSRDSMAPTGEITSDDRLEVDSLEKKWVHRTILGVALATLIIGLIGMLFAAFRGIGMSDDGYVMLLSRFPREYLVSPTQAQLFWGAIYRVLPSIPLLRIVGMALALMSTHLLCHGLLLHMKRLLPELATDKKFSSIIHTAFLSTGFATTLLFYQTPGYNHLAVITINVIVGSGLIISINADIGLPTTRLMVLSGVTGISWWLLILTKWPVAVILLILLLAWLVLERNRAAHSLRSVFIGFLGGFIPAVIVTHVLLAPLPDIVMGYQQSRNYLGPRHSEAILLNQFFYSVAIMIGELLAERWYLAIIAVCLALIANRGTRYVQDACLVILTGGYLVFEMVCGDWVGGLSNSRIDRVWPHLLLLILIFAIVRCTRDVELRKRLNFTFISAVLLALSAFILGSAGTNNPFFRNAIMSSSMLILTCVLLLSWLSRNRLIPLYLTVVAGIFVVCGSLTGTWFHPFHHAPLTEATVRIASGPASGLYVPPAVAEEIITLQSYVEPEIPTPMAIVVGHPGIVFASGATMPKHAWVSGISAEQVEELWEETCARTDSKILVLVLKSFVETDAVQRSMSTGTCSLRDFQRLEEDFRLFPPHVRDSSDYAIYMAQASK